MFARIYYLTIKEFLASLRDPKSRVILIVPPIIQVLIFSFAMTQEVKNAKLAIWNRDAGVEGAALVKSFQRTPTFRSVEFLSAEAELAPTINEERASAVLIIPQDFSETIIREKAPAKLALILDGRRANAAPILGGYIQRLVLKTIRSQALERGEHPEGHSSINVVTRNWFNPNLLPQQSFVPGLICLLSAVVGTILSGLTVAREREIGTFEQILVSPLSALEILVGKALNVLCLTTLVSTLLILIIIFGFGITLKGAPFLLFASMEAFLLSVIGIGLFVSSMSTTQQQAILGCILFLPPAIMLSGFATPLENMPSWLQTLTLANPIRWFLVIVKGLFLRGMSAAVVWENIKPMLLISLFTLSAATYMFKKRIE